MGNYFNIDEIAGAGKFSSSIFETISMAINQKKIKFLFFVFLGSAAALWGEWIEREGPRKAAFVSACCWCGGLLLSATGVFYHQLWLLWIGSGVIGGIGLGLGYISPISTLIKWFPDQRGMATGMAIMGFGGGAMIGSPLASRLMDYFSTARSTGAGESFLALAGIYFVFMTAGALSYRIPYDGWKPKGYREPMLKNLITTGNVDLNQAMRTNQFWLLWVVLCVNVTAGIGILGMASPLLQEIFGGKLIGVDSGLSDLTTDQKHLVATVASGFTGLLSLFNIAGRFFWSTLSDKIGRKYTYHIFLAFGCLLYWLIPALGTSGKLILFVSAFCMILSMYGGGFATIPAYLADLFGTKMVSAIHGRLLTAWATAGVLGPVLVNYIRDYKLAKGIPSSEVYNDTMYLLGGILIAGLMANLLIRPVHPSRLTQPEASKPNLEERLNDEISIEADSKVSAKNKLALLVAWAAVILPLLWGFSTTIKLASGLFH